MSRGGAGGSSDATVAGRESATGPRCRCGCQSRRYQASRGFHHPINFVETFPAQQINFTIPIRIRSNCGGICHLTLSTPCGTCGAGGRGVGPRGLDLVVSRDPVRGGGVARGSSSGARRRVPHRDAPRPARPAAPSAAALELNSPMCSDTGTYRAV